MRADTDLIDVDADLQDASPGPIVQRTVTMTRQKNIALVAHDNKKAELVAWAQSNRSLLARHSLFCTRTTGRLIDSTLGLQVTLLESGPLGGDLQIGSRIAEGLIDLLIFFLDPLQCQPHDCDVKALLRIAVVRNVPVACNRASADFLIFIADDVHAISPRGPRRAGRPADYKRPGPSTVCAREFEPTLAASTRAARSGPRMIPPRR